MIKDGFNLNFTAILDDFTITGGNVELYPDNFGGGMVILKCSLSLSNVIFSEIYGEPVVKPAV